MKLYNKDFIKSIQHAINKTEIKMTTFKDYSFMMPYIQIAEIKLQLYVNSSTNKREVMMIINNSDITSEYIKDWRTTAPGKFICNDFKLDKKDFIGNTLYHEISFTINNIAYKAIIRLLDEITHNDLKEETKNEFIKLYGDLKIDNAYFSIIKIYKDDEKHNLESADSRVLLETPNIKSFELTSIIENNEFLTNNKDEEETPLNLDPLF